MVKYLPLFFPSGIKPVKVASSVAFQWAKYGKGLQWCLFSGKIMHYNARRLPFMLGNHHTCQPCGLRDPCFRIKHSSVSHSTVNFLISCSWRCSKQWYRFSGGEWSAVFQEVQEFPAWLVPSKPNKEALLLPKTSSWFTCKVKPGVVLCPSECECTI